MNELCFSYQLHNINIHSYIICMNEYMYMNFMRIYIYRNNDTISVVSQGIELHINNI